MPQIRGAVPSLGRPGYSWGMRPLLAALMLLLSAATQGPGRYPNRPVRFVVPFPPAAIWISSRVPSSRSSPSSSASRCVIETKGGAAGVVRRRIRGAAARRRLHDLSRQHWHHRSQPVDLRETPYDPLKTSPPSARRPRTPCWRSSIRRSRPTAAGVHRLRQVQSGQAQLRHHRQRLAAHFACEMLKGQAGIDMQLVFYKGSGPPWSSDMLGGQVQILPRAPPVSMSLREGGPAQGHRGDRCEAPGGPISRRAHIRRSRG